MELAACWRGTPRTTCPAYMDAPPSGTPPNHTGSTDLVTSAAFSPDGGRIVSGSDDTTVRNGRAMRQGPLTPTVNADSGKKCQAGHRGQGRRWPNGLLSRRLTGASCVDVAHHERVDNTVEYNAFADRHAFGEVN